MKFYDSSTALKLVKQLYDKACSIISREDKIIERENNTDTLLALSAIDKNQKITTTIMNKEESSVPFIYENGSNSKSFSIPPRSIITIVSQ